MEAHTPPPFPNTDGLGEPSQRAREYLARVVEFDRLIFAAARLLLELDSPWFAHCLKRLHADVRASIAPAIAAGLAPPLLDDDRRPGRSPDSLQASRPDT